MTRRLLPALALAAVLAVAAPAAASPNGGAWGSTVLGGYRADAAQHAGTITELGFRADGTRGLVNAWLIEAAVDLPAGWANRYCAWAQLYVNGWPVDGTGRACDTNGDARLEFSFPDHWLRSGDVVSVWFSDPVSRYAAAHPAVRI